MNVDCIKMQAAGNDYIFLDCLVREVEDPNILARALCKRRISVGADGLILLLPSELADAKMRIFNADGSEAKMCGNAARCAARLLYESNYAKKSRITLETLSGVYKVYLTVKNRAIETIAVDMGRASVGEMFFYENGGEKYEMRAINMGNEHQVAFVPDVDFVDFDRIGPKFEKNPMFPDGVNTEICEIVGENHIKVRTFERGCGDTLACGTGACAAAVAAVVNGICSPSRLIKVDMRGGELNVLCNEMMRVILLGGARRVFEGVAHLGGLEKSDTDDHGDKI